MHCAVRFRKGIRNEKQKPLPLPCFRAETETLANRKFETGVYDRKILDFVRNFEQPKKSEICVVSLAGGVGLGRQMDGGWLPISEDKLNNPQKSSSSSSPARAALPAAWTACASNISTIWLACVAFSGFLSSRIRKKRGNRSPMPFPVAFAPFAAV